MRLWATWFVLIVGPWLCAADVYAQEEEVDADTVQYPLWEMDLAGKLSASQARYRNWTEGGINSLASTAGITGTFQRTSADWLQTYELRLAIGVIKQDTLDLRKADDLIRLKGQVSYRGNGFFRKYNPTAAATVRTQFAPGFNYDKNPFGDGRSPPVKVSDLFSPATFTQSLGLTYHADWGFKQRFGVAAKETVVMIQQFRPLYAHAPWEAVRFQLGAESQTEIDREIFNNVQLKSTLGLFAAFNQDELPDMLWENLLVMQVNEWLSADFEIVMLFDRDISDALQIKEALSIGLSVLFF